MCQMTTLETTQGIPNHSNTSIPFARWGSCGTCQCSIYMGKWCSCWFCQQNVRNISRLKKTNYQRKFTLPTKCKKAFSLFLHRYVPPMSLKPPCWSHPFVRLLLRSKWGSCCFRWLPWGCMDCISFLSCSVFKGKIPKDDAKTSLSFSPMLVAPSQ